MNLHSYFTFDGGTFYANGENRVAALSDINGAIINNFGTPSAFKPVEPFIKLAEPQYKQSVSNEDNDVRVR